MNDFLGYLLSDQFIWWRLIVGILLFVVANIGIVFVNITFNKLFCGAGVQLAMSGVNIVVFLTLFISEIFIFAVFDIQNGFFFFLGTVLVSIPFLASVAIESVGGTTGVFCAIFALLIITLQNTFAPDIVAFNPHSFLAFLFAPIGMFVASMIILIFTSIVSIIRRSIFL